MKSLLCLLGHHEYTLSCLETKVVDERCGYLICRVAICCNKCGKPFEDIIAVPIPEWLQRTNGGKKNEREVMR